MSQKSLSTTNRQGFDMNLDWEKAIKALASVTFFIARVPCIPESYMEF